MKLNLANFDKFIALLGIIIGSIALIFQILILTSRKEKTWVVSQGLYQSLAKQQLLFDKTKGKGIELEDLVEVATISSLPKAEAVRVGNKYILSTGALGDVVVELPFGIYDIEVTPIPGINFTGVRKQIKFSQSIEELRLGLTKGAGKIIQADDKPIKNPNISSGVGKLVVKLYKDTNSNGQKDVGEVSLKWAGVVVSLKLI